MNQSQSDLCGKDMNFSMNSTIGMHLAVVQHSTSVADLKAINTNQSKSSTLAGSRTRTNSAGDFCKKRPQCQGQCLMGLVQRYTLEEAVNSVKTNKIDSTWILVSHSKGTIDNFYWL